MSAVVRRIFFLLGIVFCIQLQETTALMCYDCNSAFDPRCGDPFEPFSIGSVNCSNKDPLEHLKEKYQPVLCRKTTQKIYGKVRVVRGCGYIPDERDDEECMKRLGTHDVQAVYCACTTDLCNNAESIFKINTFSHHHPLSLIFITAILAVLTRRYNFFQNS